MCHLHCFSSPPVYVTLEKQRECLNSDPFGGGLGVLLKKQNTVPLFFHDSLRT